ncbi:hypothetical protein VNO77_18829 [Canavalia gladiata]|uniref:Uncharacterized protein n=1 Tax=Canavalia gladiata TaxID=3824 RepID=A0AAN9LQF6_CANGL
MLLTNLHLNQSPGHYSRAKCLGHEHKDALASSKDIFSNIQLKGLLQRNRFTKSHLNKSILFPVQQQKSSLYALLPDPQPMPKKASLTVQP